MYLRCAFTLVWTQGYLGLVDALPYQLSQRGPTQRVELLFHIHFLDRTNLIINNLWLSKTLCWSPSRLWAIFLAIFPFPFSSSCFYCVSLNHGNEHLPSNQRTALSEQWSHLSKQRERAHYSRFIFTVGTLLSLVGCVCVCVRQRVFLQFLLSHTTCVSHCGFVKLTRECLNRGLPL